MVTKLLELPGDELAQAFRWYCQHGKSETAPSRKAEPKPSIWCKWTDFCWKNLVSLTRLENNRYERVVTPVYKPSAIRSWAHFEAEQRREAARVRIMDPVCQRLVKLLCAAILVYPSTLFASSDSSRSNNQQTRAGYVGDMYWRRSRTWGSY